MRKVFLTETATAALEGQDRMKKQMGLERRQELGV